MWPKWKNSRLDVINRWKTKIIDDFLETVYFNCISVSLMVLAFPFLLRFQYLILQHFCYVSRFSNFYYYLYRFYPILTVIIAFSMPFLLVLQPWGNTWQWFNPCTVTICTPLIIRTFDGALKIKCPVYLLFRNPSNRKVTCPFRLLKILLELF